MSHRDALKLLFPVEMGGVFDQDIAIEGAHLDDAQTAAKALLLEMFPDTVSETLVDWERGYGLDQASLPLFQRLQNLQTKFKARPNLSIPFLRSVISAYVGYDVEIVEYTVFRCDDPYSLTDFGMYAGDEIGVYQILVKLDNSRVTTPGYSLVELEAAIRAALPPHIGLTIDKGTAGFFCDDVYSLTDLTTLAL